MAASRTIRIIGGEWRGSRLKVIERDGLRPTGDRIRETLFNWLSPRLQDARCLDAFAGSGALGLEALSRGARTVDAYEVVKDAADGIADVVARLPAKDYRLHRKSLFDARFSEKAPFDIVFLDPPFAKDLLAKSFSWLIKEGVVAENSLVYLEANRKAAPVELPEGWEMAKEKTAGAVWFGLAAYCQ